MPCEEKREIGDDSDDRRRDCRQRRGHPDLVLGGFHQRAAAQDEQERMAGT